MSTCVLDLNDAGLSIADADGLRAQSPACATCGTGGVVLGAAARARARIEPRQTHTRFWQRLGTEPLHNASAQARHNADLAYLHLQELHAQAGSPPELVFAVPGSFTREQLALLLGIAERCDFRAVGLVDAALAAAAQAPGANGSLLHVEQQQHQSVLTRIDREDGQLLRREVRVLPGTGFLDMLDRWARKAADAFIQQSRFDPLHDAASEQTLYDALSGCLSRLEDADDTGVELAGAGSRHLARLRAVDMLDAVGGLYAEILSAVERDGAGCRILAGPRVAALPRFCARLKDPVILDPQAVTRGVLLHLGRIRCEDRALSFVTRLPAPPIDATAPAAMPATAQPATQSIPQPLATHLLAGDRAWRLDHERHYLAYIDGRGWALTAVRPAGPACCLRRSADGWVAEPDSAMEVLIDGRASSSATTLTIGTRIGSGAAPELRLIAETTVHDDGA